MSVLTPNGTTLPVFVKTPLPSTLRTLAFPAEPTLISPLSNTLTLDVPFAIFDESKSAVPPNVQVPPSPLVKTISPSPFSAIEDVTKNIDVPERYKSFQRDADEPISYVTFAPGIRLPVALTLPGIDKLPVLG